MTDGASSNGPALEEPNRGNVLNDEVDLAKVIAFVVHWRLFLLGATLCGAFVGAAIWLAKTKGPGPLNESKQWVVTLEAPEGTELLVAAIPAILTAELSNTEGSRAFYEAIPVLTAPVQGSPSKLDEWLARQVAGTGLIRSVTALGRQLRVTIDSGEFWTKAEAQAVVVAGISASIADFNTRFAAPHEALLLERQESVLRFTNKKAQALSLFANNSGLPSEVTKELVAHLVPLLLDDSKSLSTALFLLGSVSDAEPKKAELLKELNSAQRDLSKIDGRDQTLKKTIGLDTFAVLPAVAPVNATMISVTKPPEPSEQLRLFLVVGTIGGCLLGVMLVVFSSNFSAFSSRLRSALRAGN